MEIIVPVDVTDVEQEAAQALVGPTDHQVPEAVREFRVLWVLRDRRGNREYRDIREPRVRLGAKWVQPGAHRSDGSNRSHGSGRSNRSNGSNGSHWSSGSNGSDGSHRSGRSKGPAEPTGATGPAGVIGSGWNNGEPPVPVGATGPAGCNGATGPSGSNGPEEPLSSRSAGATVLAGTVNRPAAVGMQQR